MMLNSHPLHAAGLSAAHPVEAGPLLDDGDPDGVGVVAFFAVKGLTRHHLDVVALETNQSKRRQMDMCSLTCA